jgi:hypothetical protein
MPGKTKNKNNGHYQNVLGAPQQCTSGPILAVHIPFWCPRSASVDEVRDYTWWYFPE